VTRPESQPRHPLALLADWIEAELAWIAAPMGSVAECNARDAVEPLHTSLLSLDPVALRAQAEAQETVRALVRRSEDMGRCCGCGGEPHPIWENWEHYPGCPLAAALAQAGGES